MKDSDIAMDDASVLQRLEVKARELDHCAREPPSRIVRAVSQGQAQILREFAEEMAGNRSR